MRRQAYRRTIKINGRRFVLIEPSELRELKRRAAANRDESLPPLPEADADGNRPAVAFLQATIARDIIHERTALGLTQTQLATLAGIRQETLCRIELGRHSPTVRTVEKIDRALRRRRAASRRRKRTSKITCRTR
jgi:DNA-binding XRE family transcriptional regulator